MAKQFSAIGKLLKDNSGTAIYSSIAVVTAGLEQIATVAAYRCPCVSTSQLGENCTATTGSLSCSALLNYGYGVSFIVGPAIGLFVFGIAASPTFWKTVTGCISKTQSEKRELNDILWTYIGVVGTASISPIAWISIALLDGKYFACAATPLPYDVDRIGAQYKNCEAVSAAKTLYTSDAYNDNRSFSQVIAWILIAVLLFVGFAVYAILRATFPLTYYHAKYYKLYKSNELAEFDDEMQKKAQKDAEENVLLFMSKRRQKKSWDCISTVYEFHRDKNKLALYSNLDEWVQKNKKESVHAHEGGDGSSIVTAHTDIIDEEQ